MDFRVHEVAKRPLQERRSEQRGWAARSHLVSLGSGQEARIWLTDLAESLPLRNLSGCSWRICNDNYTSSLAAPPPLCLYWNASGSEGRWPDPGLLVEKLSVHKGVHSLHSIGLGAKSQTRLSNFHFHRYYYCTVCGWLSPGTVPKIRIWDKREHLQACWKMRQGKEDVIKCFFKKIFFVLIYLFLVVWVFVAVKAFL